MNKRIKGLVVACFSLGVALLATGPAWSVAVPEAAPLPSATLDELDEIVLHGKRMEQRMLESQERFYQLYNKLNANDDFDVTCKFLYDDPNSTGYAPAREKRGCVPMFFANAVDQSPWSYTSCSYSQAFTTTSGGTWFNDHTAPSSQSGYISRSSFSSSCYADRPTISTQSRLLWVDRRAAFEANLTTVMHSDPELQTLGGQFQSLVRENRDAQKIAAEARKLRAELKLAARKCPVPTSPRNLSQACKSG